MKTITIALACSVLAISACTTILPVAGTGTHQVQSDIETQSLARPALIKISGNRVFKGRNIRFSSDSVRWIDKKSGGLHAAPVDSVKEIVIVSRGKGIGKSAVYSLLLIPVGVIIGYAQGDDEPSGLFGISYTAGDKALFYGLGAYGIGVYAGTIYSLIRGYHTVYRFKKDSVSADWAGPR